MEDKSVQNILVARIIGKKKGGPNFEEVETAAEAKHIMWKKSKTIVKGRKKFRKIWKGALIKWKIDFASHRKVSKLRD